MTKRIVLFLISLLSLPGSARAYSIKLSVPGCPSVGAVTSFGAKVWVGVTVVPCSRLPTHYSSPHVFTISEGKLVADATLPQGNPDRQAKLVGLSAVSEDSVEAYVAYEQPDELWRYTMSKGTSSAGIRLELDQWYQFERVFSFPGLSERLVAGGDEEKARIWLLSGDKVKWTQTFPETYVINDAIVDAHGGISLLQNTSDGSKVETFNPSGEKVASYKLHGKSGTIIATDAGMWTLSKGTAKTYLDFIESRSGTQSTTLCPDLELDSLLIGQSKDFLRGIGQHSVNHEFGQFLLDQKCHVYSFSSTPTLSTVVQLMGKPVFAVSDNYLYTFRYTLEYQANAPFIEVEVFPLLPGQ